MSKVFENCLAVFDLDGTISQTDLFSVPAHIQVMSEMGYPVKTEAEIKSTYGMVQKDYLNALIGDYSSDNAMTYLRRVTAVEQELISTEGRPFDGATEMLKELRASGIKTAICSNASYRYIKMVMDAYKMFDLFDYFQPVTKGLSKIDTLGILLEHSKAQKAVMVGDTAFDMQAAEGNNIPFIGCLYGFRPEQLTVCEHKVNSACELTEKIKTLLKD